MVKRIRKEDKLPVKAKRKAKDWLGPGPGRPKGMKNLVPRALSEAILEATSRLGFPEQVKDGKWIPTANGGIVGYCMWLGLNFPSAHAGLMKAILPKQVDVTVDNKQDTEEYTKQKLVEKLAKRGIDLSLLNSALDLELGEFSSDRNPPKVEYTNGKD